MTKKNANKTQATTQPVEDFLAPLTERRAAEAQQLIAIMGKISKEPATMWGPSIIGFGTQAYKSESGREGDMPLLAFSPRKSALTIYFYEGFNPYGEELKQLGKHKTSLSCLYINKLEDVDLKVLEKMLKLSYKESTSKAKKYETVQDYIDAMPEQARPAFDQLRALVRQLLPDAKEVLSYGVIGYKVDEKRARVFISGWKDHLAIYPVPKDEALERELTPYRKGKGTLWFALDETLPIELITRTVLALTQ